MAKIPLFDIDGTLLRAGSKVHVESYAVALNSVLGCSIKSEDIDIHSFQGMTDSGILIALAMQHNCSENYAVQKLPELIRLTADYFLKNYHNPCDRFPGVLHLLRFLRSKNIPIGILTGNIEKIARRRIQRANLGEIAGGGFGDCSPNRIDLAYAAQKSISQHLGHSVPLNNFVIIGDTVKDYKCAQDAGIESILVINGSGREDELRACGAKNIIKSFEGNCAYIKNFLMH